MSMENPTQREVFEKELIAKTIDTVPSGQEWNVTQLLKSEVTVEAGAKLVVTELAAKNKIVVKEGGELEITGEDLMNEVVRGEEIPAEKSEENLVEPAPKNEYEEKMNELNRQELENLKSFKPEVIEKMRIAVEFIKVDVERSKKMNELASQGLVENGIIKKYLQEAYEQRINIVLNILKWPDTGRDVVKGLLRWDEENNRSNLETLVADRDKIDAVEKQ